MEKYRIDCGPHIDPRWFYPNYGKKFYCVVEDGRIEVKGEKLWFVDEEKKLPNGTEVRVHLDRFFYCIKMEDVIKRSREKGEAKARNKAVDYFKRDLRMTYALWFNSKYELPVQWDIGIKDVLSGLQINSWGDGRNKATVHHILLLEDLEAGRLKRKKGDFLCTSRSGSNGKRWGCESGAVERCHPFRDVQYAPRITCKSCLRLAGRFKKD